MSFQQVGGEGAVEGNHPVRMKTHQRLIFFRVLNWLTVKTTVSPEILARTTPPNPLLCTGGGAWGKKQIVCRGSRDAPSSVPAGTVYVQRAVVEEILLRFLLAGWNVYERYLPGSGLWNMSPRTHSWKQITLSVQNTPHSIYIWDFLHAH